MDGTVLIAHTLEKCRGGLGMGIQLSAAKPSRDD